MALGFFSFQMEKKREDGQRERIAKTSTSEASQ